MTVSEDETDRATQEAARWLVALEDDPEDAGLRARFEAWRGTSSVYAEAWRETAEIYGLMAQIEPATHAMWPDATPRRSRQSGPAHMRRRSVRAGSRPKRRFIAGIAAAAAVACLAIWGLPNLVLRLQADVVTTTAELRTVRLPDGSSVRLAPESALALAFADGHRDVQLLRGEAFFEVTHDPAHPFHVSAHGVEITDVGTSFDVSLAGNGTVVAVRSGAVRVEDAAATPPVRERLAPGESVRIDRNGRSTRNSVSFDEVAPWIDGQIVARDRSVTDLVNELRRDYGGIIMLASPSLGQERVTGVYNVADPAAALAAIAGAHSGQVHRLSPWLLVITGD